MLWADANPNKSTSCNSWRSTTTSVQETTKKKINKAATKYPPCAPVPGFVMPLFNSRRNEQLRICYNPKARFSNALFGREMNASLRKERLNTSEQKPGQSSLHPSSIAHRSMRKQQRLYFEGPLRTRHHGNATLQLRTERCPHRRRPRGRER